MRWVGQIFYFENFHAVFFRLLVLVRVQGTDADLDEAVDELLFHDSRERAGVGVGIAFVIAVKIGMGVEMDEGDSGDLLADAAKNWVGDGVIAAEADWPFAGFHDFCDRIFDARERVGRLHCRQIAGVFKNSRNAEVDAGFGGFVPAVGVQRLADERRSLGGTAKKRRVVVKRNPEKYRRAPRSEFWRERLHGRVMSILPRTSASICVRRKQSSASSGRQTMGSLSLKDVFRTTGTPVWRSNSLISA